MKILVINVGSTSLKYDAYDMDTETRIANGSLDGVVARADIAAAVAGLPTRLGISSAEIGAVGHRVVHGGEHGVKPMKIDAAVERIIEECAQFAPSHNPRSLAAVRPRATHFRVCHTSLCSTRRSTRRCRSARTCTVFRTSSISNAAFAVSGSTGQAINT